MPPFCTNNCQWFTSAGKGNDSRCDPRPTRRRVHPLVCARSHADSRRHGNHPLRLPGDSPLVSSPGRDRPAVSLEGHGPSYREPFPFPSRAPASRVDASCALLNLHRNHTCRGTIASDVKIRGDTRHLCVSRSVLVRVSLRDVDWIRVCLILRGRGARKGDIDGHLASKICRGVCYYEMDPPLCHDHDPCPCPCPCPGRDLALDYDGRRTYGADRSSRRFLSKRLCDAFGEVGRRPVPSSC